MSDSETTKIEELPKQDEPVRRLTEKRGDIFAERGVTHIAHCISIDCAMGAGFAQAVATKYGGDTYRRLVRAEEKTTIGQVAVVTTPDGKTVYNLLTKRRYFEKPRLLDLVECLVHMKTHALAAGVRRIVMPRIGCGLDRLAWADVSEAINQLFERSGIAIDIIDVSVPRKRAPEARENDAKRPRALPFEE